nr:hypothetical protein [Tanacetum cinerariifolium]
MLESFLGLHILNEEQMSQSFDIVKAKGERRYLALKAKKVKCKYVTRNTGKGRKNEENANSYEASKALRSIQELADHSHKWHNEECKNTPPFSIIAKKLKALNHETDELRVDVRKIIRTME